ncbi:MAG TPA: nitroreductase/quinone reductase family protein [Ktedonobacterales bacterium]|nr:nitroreductase/quinone reductase family protein [Ktedonobacterales bacterium]
MLHETTVEVGTETFIVTATVITGEERDQLYARQVERAPVFAEYQARTTRLIRLSRCNDAITNGY